MVHPPPYPDAGDDADVGTDREPTAGVPRWAAVAGIAIAIILLLLIVALHLSGVIGPGVH